MCFYCVWKYLENTVMIAVRSRYFNDFSDFTAWNATFGVDGEWRKLVYRQTPSMLNENLVKIEITKRVYLGFCQKN